MLESGIDLPAQWGVATFLSQSESRLPIENLKYGFSEDEPLTSDPLVTMDELDNKILNTGLILDCWVLPMLDVYAMGAQWDLSQHFVLISEYGFDTVESLTFALNCRWE